MINNLQVLILAGGKGTRLKSVVSDRPKVIADINGKPFLDFVLDHLISQGVTKSTLLTGYKAEMIVSTYGSMYKSMSLSYSSESRPLGTGGAVKAALSRLSKKTSHCLVINGDTYFPAPFNSKTNSIDICRDYIFSIYRDNCDRYGSLKVDPESNRILFFDEKSTSRAGIINAGSYLLRTQALLSYKKDAFSLEQDYLPLLAGSSGSLFCQIEACPFIDIGIPSDYNQFISQQ